MVPSAAPANVFVLADITAASLLRIKRSTDGNGVGAGASAGVT